jgi:hypothetical protein
VSVGLKSVPNAHDEVFARLAFAHFLRAMEREGRPLDVGTRRAEQIDRLIDEAIREARVLPTKRPDNQAEVDRFYIASAWPAGTLVRDLDDPDRIGDLVRRVARLWVDRDSKPPLVRWRGRLDTEEIPWNRIERVL